MPSATTRNHVADVLMPNTGRLPCWSSLERSSIGDMPMASTQLPAWKKTMPTKLDHGTPDGSSFQ